MSIPHCLGTPRVSRHASALSNLVMITASDLTDLLTLAVTDQAERLTLQVGEPPVIHLGGEPHSVEGPGIVTPENADKLLQTVATPSQVLECRTHGSTEFTDAFHGSAHFKVKATMQR